MVLAQQSVGPAIIGVILVVVFVVSIFQTVEKGRLRKGRTVDFPDGATGKVQTGQITHFKWGGKEVTVRGEDGSEYRVPKGSVRPRPRP